MNAALNQQVENNVPEGDMDTDDDDHGDDGEGEEEANLPPTPPVELPDGPEADLWRAATAGDVARIEELLRLPGIDVNFQDSVHQRTPFYRACGHDRLEAVKRLLADPRVNVNHQQGEGASSLYIACQEGHINVVRELLRDERIDVNLPMTDGRTPFYAACLEGFAEVAAALIAHPKVDINRQMDTGFSPLYVAAQQGKTEIVRMILDDRRADPNLKAQQGYTALYTACEKGWAEIVDIFLNDPRTEVDTVSGEDGSTLLFVAAEQGRVEVVQRLLRDPRIDENKTDNLNTTPLWIAAQNGRLDVIKWMVAMRPTLDLSIATVAGTEDWHNKTAYQWAREIDVHLTADLLQELEADRVGVRDRILRELGFHAIYASEVFALMVLHCDGYLQVRRFGSVQAGKQICRFFSISARLPQDLQIVLANRLYRMSSEIIPSSAREKAFRALILRFYQDEND